LTWIQTTARHRRAAATRAGYADAKRAVIYGPPQTSD
jgi:hypothetical protein